GSGAAQFLPVQPVPSVAETAEPLVTVGLQDGGAGTNDLPTLAPGVARGTDLIQATLGSRQLQVLWQGALAGYLSGAIDIKDKSGLAHAIQQLTCLPLLRERARKQVVEKECAQGFGGRRRQRRQKA